MVGFDDFKVDGLGLECFAVGVGVGVGAKAGKGLNLGFMSKGVSQTLGDAGFFRVGVEALQGLWQIK